MSVESQRVVMKSGPPLMAHTHTHTCCVEEEGCVVNGERRFGPLRSNPSLTPSQKECRKSVVITFPQHTHTHKHTLAHIHTQASTHRHSHTHTHSTKLHPHLQITKQIKMKDIIVFNISLEEVMRLLLETETDFLYLVNIILSVFSKHLEMVICV